jgi:endonuclease G, mitochondrial
MATFRSNHSSSNRSGLGHIFRVIVLAALLIYLLWRLLLYFQAYQKQGETPQDIGTHDETDTILKSSSHSSVSIEWPSRTAHTELIIHTHYALSYSIPHEQAEWVSYQLTVDELNAPKVSRTDYFAPDRSVRSKSAVHRDYTGSGFTRGHLAPAADMRFDLKASEESFYMSNISPQEKYFNQGVWRELEESVRDWARKYRALEIVTGPVLNQKIIKKIGDSRVSVPAYFYKVVLDTLSVKSKGIGFILANEKSDKPLTDFMVSIDSVEQLTGLDFFNAISKANKIEQLEKSFDTADWPLKPDRYQRRVTEWNKNK